MKSTKELARELGFIRKRSSSTSSRLFRSSDQIYPYLIVLDFESTCWKDTKQRPQEIIEFPAVLVNTRNGNIESEFQYYVQPVESPVLSDFCRELTGISQRQVEEGIPLNLCLVKFSQWIQKNALEKDLIFGGTVDENKNKCILVTWSDWDLGVCLLYECRRKQYKRPPALNNWIDLRATYRKFYQRRPQGLNGALQDVGIKFEGREHSGLDDARNTAKLAWRMICDGCVMKETKSIDGQTRSNQPKLICPPTKKSTPTSKEDSDCRQKETSDKEKPANFPKDQNVNYSSCKISIDPSFNRTVKRMNSGLPKDSHSKGKFTGAVSIFNKASSTVKCGYNNVSKGLRDVTNVDRSNQQFKKPKLSPESVHCESPVGEEHLDCSLISSGLVIENRNHSNNLLKKTESVTPVLNVPLQKPNSSSMAKTPPMCGCGRRCHRKTAQTPGPNMGRTFFCCPVGRRGPGQKSSCGFFKWDTLIQNCNRFASPVLRGYTNHRNHTNTASILSYVKTPGQPNFSLKT